MSATVYGPIVFFLKICSQTDIKKLFGKKNSSVSPDGLAKTYLPYIFRQKRQALYDSEQRFDFADKCRRQLQAIADDLSQKLEVEKKNFADMANADL